MGATTTPPYTLTSCNQCEAHRRGNLLAEIAEKVPPGFFNLPSCIQVRTQ